MLLISDEGRMFKKLVRKNIINTWHLPCVGVFCHNIKDTFIATICSFVFHFHVTKKDLLMINVYSGTAYKSSRIHDL